MRTIAVLTVALVAACAAPQRQDLADRPPSLKVAETAMESGSPQVALQICSDWVAREPGNLEAQVCQGDALTVLGRRDEAEAAFTRAQTISPNAIRVLMGLGRLELATDAVAAETLFQRVVDREPANAAAWNDIGIARDLQGRHAQAQEAYGRALGAAPDMHAAEVNLALSMAMSGHAEEAVQRLRSLATNPNATPQLRHDLAAALAMANHSEEAAKLLQRELGPEEIDQAIAGYRALPDAASPAALPMPAPKAVQPPPPDPVRPFAAASAAAVPPPQARQAAPPVPSPGPPVAAPAAAASAGRASAARSIVLRARMDTWLRVSDRDGRAVLNRLMHAGDSWQVPPESGAGPLLLSTGNAGGVDVLIDGEPAPSLGGEGAVRHDIPLDAQTLLAGKGAAPGPAVRPAPLRP